MFAFSGVTGKHCTSAGVFSPVRIPLECWEALTKAPFTCGALEEEPVHVMVKGERELLSTKRKRMKTLLALMAAC